MKSAIRKVRKPVGMNPIARAVAKRELERKVEDMRIACLMMDDGERCMDRLAALPLMMRSLLFATGPSMLTPGDLGMLRSGDKVLSEMSERGTWRKSDLQTIDNALVILSDVWPQLPPDQANAGIQQAMRESACTA